MPRSAFYRSFTDAQSIKTPRQQLLSGHSVFSGELAQFFVITLYYGIGLIPIPADSKPIRSAIKYFMKGVFYEEENLSITLETFLSV